MSLEKWCSGLITQLLEITHGQWLYQNYVVHDPVSGTIAMVKKEELLLEIERQCELRDAGYWRRINTWQRGTLRKWHLPWENGNIIGYWLYRPHRIIMH